MVASCMTKEVIVPLKGMTQILQSLMSNTKSKTQKKGIMLAFSTT